MRLRYWIWVWMLAVVLGASGGFLWPIKAQEGKAPACDNDPDNHKRGEVHDCKCERTETKCKTSPDKVQMSEKCKTYCRPEACKCTNMECS